MNTMETLCKRRSIRSYNGENITDAELKQILKAAHAAPVGRGLYVNYAITVVTNKEYMDKINTATTALIKQPDMIPLYGAPTVIIVSAKLSGTPADNVAYSSAACIVHNMILEAVDLGVGACHIWGAISGLNSDPELVKELNLPEGFTPCCAAILGHTDEVYEEREIPEGCIRTDYLK